VNRARGLTLVEVVVIVLIAAVLVLVFFLPPLRERRLEQRNQVSCQNNLKQIGTALSMYAAEHNGEYPPLQTWVGDDCDEKNTDVLMFNGPMMYPEYFADIGFLVCPSDVDSEGMLEDGAWDLPGQAGVPAPCRFDDSSYVYLAWVFCPTERSVGRAQDSPTIHSEWPAIEAALWDALDAPDPGVFLGPLTYVDPVSGEQRSVPRMGEAAAVALAGEADQALTDAVAARIPVMHDAWVSLSLVSMFKHIPGASNVLHFDGHVEFVRFPGRFPMAREWGQLLGRIRNETFPGAPAVR